MDARRNSMAERDVQVACRNCKTQEICTIKIGWFDGDNRLLLKLSNNFKFLKDFRDKGINIVCKKCNKPVSTLRYEELQDF